MDESVFGEIEMVLDDEGHRLIIKIGCANKRYIH
jgi:hypothetical protein